MAPPAATGPTTQPYLRLFGRPELQWDRSSFPLPFERRNQLIAYLAMRRSWVGRAELAELLWPDQTSKLSLANLRKTVFRLQSLPWGGALEAQGSALRFSVRTDVEDIGGAQVKPAAFEELLAGYEDGGEGWSQWLGFERERTRVAWRASVLKRLQEDGLDANEAIELSGWLLESDPADESALLTHMDRLARAGQPGRAREAYRMFQARLANDFGLEPSAAAKSALEAIERPGKQLVGNELPTLRGDGTAQADKDDQGFVGRVVELRQVEGWLTGAGTRVVCIIGQGGAGKTRLARRAMQQLAPRFEHGARFVPLEDVAADGDVIARLARTLGLTLSGPAPTMAQVAKVLHDRHMLLVFDNFEHLQGGAAALTELLRECPRLSALVTSRIRPALAEQQSLQLDGLPCPDAMDEDNIETFDAVRVFINTARRADPAFNAAIGARSIIDICRQVEGLPLALEIAAGWTRVLSCAAIAGELRHSSELLETVDAARPARHASMEAVFEQSWALLTNAEREAFSRLSVFRGGFTPAAARSIARAPLPVLGALADKSLLRKDGERLQIHPLLRQLAATRLAKAGAQEETEAAHALHYHQLMAQLRRASVAGDRAVLDELEVDADNCRKAWRWSIANGRADLLSKSVPTVRNFVDHRGRFQDGLAFIREAADHADPPLDRARPLLLSVAAHLEYRLDRYMPAIETASRAQSLAGKDDIEARLQCAKTLAVCNLRLGQYDQSRHYFKEALALAPETDDPRNAAAMLDNLSLVEKAEGKMDEALKMSLAALAKFREIRDVAGEALCLNNIGTLQGDMGHTAASIGRLQEALALAEKHQLAGTKGFVLANLTEQYAIAGELDNAREYAQRALETVRATGNRSVEGWIHLQQVQTELRAGDVDAACAALQLALELAIAMKGPRLLVDVLEQFAHVLDAVDAKEAAAGVRRWLLGQPALLALQKKQVEEKLVGRSEGVPKVLEGMTPAEVASRAALECAGRWGAFLKEMAG